MQHPQQSPQMFNIPSSQPTTNVTTEQIQKYLDENKQLILAIMENQSSGGKLNDCAQYQAQLQKNLMYLAAIADAQPPAPTGPSQPQQSPIPQGPSFMQQPQPAITQQPPGLFGSRLPFNLQSHDQQQQQQQQQTPIQMQQSMIGGMGMRAGGNTHPGHGSATHLMMDAHTRQDGSESGYGDGQGKSSGQGWGNRDS